MIKNGEVKYLQTFTVRGRGLFPMDMLRYDQCWPMEGVHGLEGRNREMVEVKLGRWVDHPSRMPTEARWNSFLWGIDRQSIMTCVDGELITSDMVDEDARKTFGEIRDQKFRDTGMGS